MRYYVYFTDTRECVSACKKFTLKKTLLGLIFIESCVKVSFLEKSCYRTRSNIKLLVRLEIFVSVSKNLLNIKNCKNKLLRSNQNCIFQERNEKSFEFFHNHPCRLYTFLRFNNSTIAKIVHTCEKQPF